MENLNISNNSNNGDIIVNVGEEIDANYCISKGNICLKNMNYEGAFDFFYQATFYECTEEQLYHCYKQLMFLTITYEEKHRYLSKIFKLKTIKKTKLDVFMYILITLIIFLKEEPYIIFFFLIIGFKFFYL